MLQGFGYLGLHRLDRNPHFPGNFLISLPFLPTFAINLPTFVRKGTNSFFNQSVQFFHLHRSISRKSISIFFSSLDGNRVLFIALRIQATIACRLAKICRE